MRFKIYGDYGFEGEALLEEFDTYGEAKRWFERYTRWGDMGGHDRIEIAEFNKDGEYIV